MDDESSRQLTSLPETPYPGIEPYTYADRDVFFSREAESRRLSRLVVLYRGVLLYSDSGNGKSSLINAGVIPLAVQEGFQPQRIRVQPRQGQEIVVERLSEKVHGDQHLLPSLLTPDETQERATLSVENFLAVLKKKAAKERPLLVFDQFEEWVTLFEERSSGQKAGEAQAIQDAIRDAIVCLVNDGTLPVKVLISLREDYLAKLTPFFKRCPNLSDQYLRLVPLNGDQIYRVIRGPFEQHPGRYPREIHESLAREIKTEFENRSGGAPIRLTEVQIVCRNLFESGKEGNDLDAFFTRQGGVQGILEQHLERWLESLEVQQREPAICLLTRMVTSAGTRMVIPEEDLLGRVEHEDGIPRELLNKTLANLEQKAKLVQRGKRRDVDYYEIASEFLVDWIRKKAQEHRLQTEQGRIQERQRVKRRRLAVRVSAGVLLLLAVVVTVSFGMRAIRKGHENESRRLAGEASKMLFESGQKSLQLAQLAVSETYPRYKSATPEAEWALRRALLATLPSTAAPKTSTLPGLEKPIYELAFSDNGKSLASVSSDNTVIVWDFDSRKRLHTFDAQTSQRVSVALNSDGSRVAIGSGDHVVRVWDVSSGNALSAVLADGHSPSGFSFAKEAKSLELDDSRGFLDVRDSISGRIVFSLRPKLSANRPLVLSRNGQRLATINSEGSVRVWDTVSGQELLTIPYNGGSEVRAAFSSDGNRLAIASRFNLPVMIWDVPTRRVAYSLPGAFRPGLNVLAIGQDGTRLAVGYLYPKIEAVTWQKNTRLLSAAFSAGHMHLATASQDGTVKAWDAFSRWERLTLPGQIDVVLVASSPDGMRLATASRDGTVKVWDASTGQALLTKSGLSGRPVIFSPDSTRLATANKEDGTIRVWDTSSGLNLQTIHLQVDAKLVVFCPNNTRLVADNADGTMTIWDLSLGSESKELQIPVRDPGRVAFSPDCRRLVTTSLSGPIKLWDASSGTDLLTFSGFRVQSLAFSPDGTRLATAHEDTTLRVWDTSSGLLLNTLPSNGKRALAMTFGPAGRDVATVSEDGEVRVDVLSVEELTALARKQASASLTSDDCKRFSLHQKRCEALDLLVKAGELAGAGELKEAIAALTKAKDLDSTLSFVPEAEAKRMVAKTRIAEAGKLARAGDIASATKKFQEAKSLNPSLQIDPEAEAKRPLAQARAGEGRKLARAGDVAAATKKFQEAKSLDPSLRIDPMAEAQLGAVQGRVAQGLHLAGKGKINEALAAFRDAQKLDPTKIGGESWNSLCWQGTLWGRADQVIRSCEEALRLEPGNWHFMDSRGLARALTNNKPGAIKDFEFYVSHADNVERKMERERWISALRQGRNPFTPEVRKSLFAEGDMGIEIETDE
jgi:WD40 repeat protein/tetratricopeptide (TPR) repeat protein